MPIVAPHAVSPQRRHHDARRLMRLVVYIMLVVSAVAALLFGDKLSLAWKEGLVPMWAMLLAPGAFTAFVVMYAIERFLLVRHENYPLNKALAQVGFALIFLTLLLPQQTAKLRQLQYLQYHNTVATAQLLAYPDATVRSGVCDLLSGELNASIYDNVNLLAQQDPSELVRQSCSVALTRLKRQAASH